MTLAALFIAQATNTELSLGHQIMLLLVAMLSSKGAAGVTGAASSRWPRRWRWCRKCRSPAWR